MIFFQCAETSTYSLYDSHAPSQYFEVVVERDGHFRVNLAANRGMRKQSIMSQETCLPEVLALHREYRFEDVIHHTYSTNTRNPSP